MGEPPELANAARTSNTDFMPPKTDPRVDAYIAESAAFAQPIRSHLRALVHQSVPEATETIKWSMPHFEHHGILCRMAAFKAHVTFGFRHDGVAGKLGLDGKKDEEAMGNLGRITRLTELPGDAMLIRSLKKAAQLNASGEGTRPAYKPKPAPAVPADLAAALKKNPPAAAAFDKFSPSHRREYIEWITEAKREETRAKRLEQTMEWLAEGKKRNWKYENC